MRASRPASTGSLPGARRSKPGEGSASQPCTGGTSACNGTTATFATRATRSPILSSMTAVCAPPWARGTCRWCAPTALTPSWPTASATPTTTPRTSPGGGGSSTWPISPTLCMSIWARGRPSSAPPRTRCTGPGPDPCSSPIRWISPWTTAPTATCSRRARPTPACISA